MATVTRFLLIEKIGFFRSAVLPNMTNTFMAGFVVVVVVGVVKLTTFIYGSKVKDHFAVVIQVTRCNIQIRL